jgi:hypothetical protein
MSTAGKRAFRYIKINGESTLLQISDGIGMPPDEVRLALDGYVESGFIKFNPDTKTYKVKFYLTPSIPTTETTTTRFWSYEAIKNEQQKQQGDLSKGSIKLESTAIPRKWRNPYLAYLPRRISQGDRGTCVGFAAAISLTLLYYKLTQDLPTQGDLNAAMRDVSVDIGCANKKPFVCDRFDKRWKSPQFIYDVSRIVGNVTEPSGSYVSDAAKTCVKYGAVFETECNTAKTPTCVPQWYPHLPGETASQSKERLLKSASGHKCKGFAQITTFEGICEAVYTHGSVMLPIDIYENYTSNGCAGLYPDPRGSNVGGHAQCVVGYDLDARTLEFRQSWGDDWTEDGGISERYYNIAASAAFVILDDEETRIGNVLYTHITVSSNVPCNFTINGEQHTFNDRTVMLERGIPHTIVATPIDPLKIVELNQSTTITPEGEFGGVLFTFAFKPIPIPTPPPKNELVTRIMALLRKMIEMLTKR